MNRKIKKDIDFRETTSFKEAIRVLHNVNVDKTLKERISYKDATFPLVFVQIYIIILLTILWIVIGISCSCLDVEVE